MEDGSFSIEEGAHRVHPTTTGNCITVRDLRPVSSIHFPHIVVCPKDI